MSTFLASVLRPASEEVAHSHGRGQAEEAKADTVASMEEVYRIGAQEAVDCNNAPFT